MDKSEFMALWKQVVARAEEDQDFKIRLIDDPKTVLSESGINAPDGVNFIIHENTGNTINLVLPKSSSGELSESELDGISGGLLALDSSAPPPQGDPGTGGDMAVTFDMW